MVLDHLRLSEQVKIKKKRKKIEKRFDETDKKQKHLRWEKEKKREINQQ